MLPDSWNRSSIDRIEGLDGLRGLAILLVLTFHLHWHSYGKAGVMLFFVLSGFLITRVLQKAAARRGVGAYLRQFYVRRSLRIFPLYFGTVGLIAFGGCFLAYSPALKSALPYAATFTLNIERAFVQDQHVLGHFWSLCVEEHFYLFWPLLVFLLHRRIRLLSLALIVAGPLIRAITGHFLLAFPAGEEHLDYATAVYYLSTSHIDAFAVGAFLSTFGFHTPRESWRAAGILAGATMAGLVLGLGFCGLWPVPAVTGELAPAGGAVGSVSGAWAAWPYVWTYSLVNLGSGTLMLLVLEQRFFRRLFSMEWLRYTGTISYGLYVLHYPVKGLLITGLATPLQAVGSASVGVAILNVIYLVVVFVAAALSYRYYESPFLRLKDLWAGPSSKPPEAQASEIRTA